MTDTTTASADDNHFHAAAWLAKFEKAGGGYLQRPDGDVLLCSLLTQPSIHEQASAQRMLNDLSQGDRYTLLAHIEGRDTSPEAMWAERFAAMEEANEHYQASLGKTDPELDDACNQYVDARDALMQTPAPSLSALRWKLDELLQIEDEGTSAWDASYAAQTIADYQRLLVDPS